MRLAAIAAVLALPCIAHAACPPDDAVARLADALVAGRPVDPFPALSLADAICTRDKLVPLLERHWGRVVGYKAGLTSEAVQRRYGLSSPVRGSIFVLSVSIPDDGEIPSRFGEAGTIGVEADLIVRVRDEGINTAGRDRLAILRHIDQIVPFIEMPLTGLSGTLDAAALVSVNVAARLGVVGRPFAPEVSDAFVQRLGAMTVVLSDDTREIARAPGTALLGHPLDVIPWLVEDLARSGLRLRAGDMVSLGGFAPSVPSQPGRRYTLRYEGLAAEPVTVSVRVR